MMPYVLILQRRRRWPVVLIMATLIALTLIGFLWIVRLAR